MRQSFGSSDLDDRLKQIIEKKQKVEQDYQDTNQRFWTIMFIDASNAAKSIWALGEDEANTIIDVYQQLVRAALSRNGACFVEPGGGPQVVCCFESPENALLTAQAVIDVMAEWNKQQPADIHIIPAIGVHQGYINFHDGIIHQSNTNNKSKRIQTEAGPGDVFVSSEIHQTLEKNPIFSFKHIGSFSLKNIPEPQDIYKVVYKTLSNLDGFTVNPIHDGDSVTSSITSNAAIPKESFQWVFVYIDVCESTKKFWKFGDREASKLIEDYQKLCHTTFKQYACSYVKSCEGDQIIAAFEMEAINSAAISSIKILKDLFRRNVNVKQAQQVRAAIGIHSGEVILEGEEPVTTGDMRIGKAIQSQATADEILVSDQVVMNLDPQIQGFISSYGACDFADKSEPTEVYSLNWTSAKIRPALLNPPRRPRRTR